MKKNHVLALLIGSLILISSGLVHTSSQFQGFPDGALTELDRAEQNLKTLFVWVSVPSGLWFVLLGRIVSQQATVKAFRISLISYVLFVLLLLLIDVYLGARLDNGGGG